MILPLTSTAGSSTLIGHCDKGLTASKLAVTSVVTFSGASGMANRDSFDDFDTDDQDDGFLTFDARDEEEDKSRGPLVIAAIVAVLLICGIILWQLYAGSRDNGDTPQIAADTGSFKAAPADPGAVAAPDLDKGVFDALLADGAAVPDPAAMPAPAPAPAKAVTTPTPAPPKQVAQATPPKAAPAPAPKPTPVKVAEAAPRPAPVATPKAVTPAPAPKAVEPTPVPVPAAAPAPAPKAAPAPARPSSSGIAAQLGSFQTRAAADVALARYRASGLSGPVSVVAADLGEKGTWYRIRATGFDTRAEVDSFCSKARSAGAQCIPSGR
jgi:cytoskeletal protein RodZ